MLMIFAACLLSVVWAAPQVNDPSVPRECPLYTCVPCQTGYVIGADGCQTCTCKFECPLYKCMPCETGYVIGADGCQTCTCKTETRAACSDVMCKMFCINGFKTGSDGCPICSCA